MKTKRAGVEMIKAWEGCRLTAYPDPATKAEPYTIGYGITSAAGVGPVRKGMTITAQQAEDMLVMALSRYEASVSKALKRVPNQNQFDAMVSLCWNIGEGAFAGSSVIWRFNTGDVTGAADAFRMWNKGGGKVMPGLVNRREAERQLFLRPTATMADMDDATAPPVGIPIPGTTSTTLSPAATGSPANDTPRKKGLIDLIIDILMAIFGRK